MRASGTEPRNLPGREEGVAVHGERPAPRISASVEDLATDNKVSQGPLGGGVVVERDPGIVDKKGQPAPVFLKAFEDVRGGGRKGSAHPFGPGSAFHLGEDLPDGLACGAHSVPHLFGFMEMGSNAMGPFVGPRGEFVTLDGGFEEVPADTGPAGG